MKKFIALEEALEILNKNTKALKSEVVSIKDSLKRVLYGDVKSKINNPPFNKSVFDGYAFRSEDSKGTSKENPIELKIVDEIFAGMWPEIEIKHGEAVRIMTGAPIPVGADCVLKQEETERHGDLVKIFKEMKVNENISFMGEDIKIGETLIKKGKRLDYADLGIMASSGISEVLVYKKPRVSIISTGDEVCDINSTLKPGKIYDSNLYSLSARIEELGYNVLSMEHVGDNIIKIGKAIEKAFEKSDIVFTTGGASVGEKDLMQKVSESIGFEKLFWKIKIKPGSAVVCSKKEEKILISLSGNPNAALTTFELLGKSVLKKLEGEEENINIKREKGILMDSFNKKSPQRRFLRGNVIYDEKGAKVYITQIKSGNGILSSLLNANCLIEIEKGNEGLNKGEVVNIIKL
ncbi:molybdopterin molybdotransferase MoeA [Clostridium perfringens]|uniref:Molybdopterin molybdenumtransferase n=2 Tax=Clostridium perfringens TaxID=1502 RepID=A0A2X2YBJ0_CLOPF|nr:gephyrin-like molybdotransferase Glp [Clostridium perfringens]ALG49359.1 Molybdopterin biosynthesis protein MoeA [Clostridium perfringens]AXH53000.1 molybdopterin molybdenumtransferase MoeA [Clostridium perfringens]EDS80415.1 molybdenum cofactor biosynthesis protein MoeA [Clostridium perfringens C str. JGS1495]EDT14081.1 molybdenum cofactor biosynthesis protein MoeA [Clostridium perfringens E str. JGS1987]EHK2387516.1 molybdopterin molybdotransferase MoeA [Clostridium perfringens]